MNDLVKKLEEKLKYLTDEAREKEVQRYKDKITNKTDIEKLATDIYLSRGLDPSKFNKNIFSSLITEIENFTKVFDSKEKKIKSKMFVEVIYFIILIILLKIPFDLVRDISYDYISTLTSSEMVYNLWNIGFLLIYTITAICTSIVMIRNFNKKYLNN